MAERSCFTGAHARDDMGAHDSRCCRLIAGPPDGAVDADLVAYLTAAYVEGRPVDRTVVCPRWSPLTTATGSPEAAATPAAAADPQDGGGSS